MKKQCVLGLAIGLLVCQVASAHAAIFLQIPGMQGEAVEKDHVGWIEVNSLSFGHGEAPPGAPVKVQFARVNVAKRADSLSAALALLAANGQAIPQLKVEILRSISATPVIMFKMKLTNARVASFSSSAQSDHTDSIGLSFDTITWISTRIDSAGKPVPGTFACWDLAKNAVCPVNY